MSSRYKWAQIAWESYNHVAMNVTKREAPARDPETSVALRPRQGINTTERVVVVAVLALTVWGLLQIGAHYPREFFPRFADEAIYALDSRIPATVFKEFDPDMINYAPSKLGYGIPLAASVVVAGPNGPMYLSTIFWLATVVMTGVLAWRALGSMTAMIATAMLSFSPMFGKYVADVGPTSEAALALVLFWGAACTRRSWLVGLAIGWLAFIDFKWALPSGLAYVLIEAIVDTQDRLSVRVQRVVIAGVTALAVVGAAAILHEPYGGFLGSYVTRHGDQIAFAPSPIFLYYLFVFGALPAILIAAAVFTLPHIRHVVLENERLSGRPLARAACIFAAPVIFFSLFGELKALRFFAVPFPLLEVVVGAVLATIVRRVSLMRGDSPATSSRKILSAALLAVVTVVLIHGGSDGPAHHLTLPTGYPDVITRLQKISAEGDRISSYNWSVLAYTWDKPGAEGSFAFVGLHDADRWIVLDPIHDRATIELRLRQGTGHANPDSTWAYQRNVFRSVSDSLFSVRCDFYASDYFLSEIVPDGISVFRRWRSWRSDADWMTVYEIDPVKLKSGWRQ